MGAIDVGCKQLSLSAGPDRVPEAQPTAANARNGGAALLLQLFALAGCEINLLGAEPRRGQAARRRRVGLSLNGGHGDSFAGRWSLSDMLNTHQFAEEFQMPSACPDLWAVPYRSFDLLVAHSPAAPMRGAVTPPIGPFLPTRM